MAENRTMMNSKKADANITHVKYATKKNSFIFDYISLKKNH